MSESDGKTWAMVKPETGERVSVGQLSDEAPGNDGTAIDKLWGQVRSALEQGLGRVDSGVFAVVLHAIRTAESLGRNEERRRIEGLLGAVPGDDEAVTVALSWLSQAIYGKEEGDRAAFSERIHKTRLGWIEQTAQRHVEALRDLCFSRGDPLPTGSVEAMDQLGLLAHLALSLDRRARRIEELAAAALSSPPTYTEDPADAYARGLADGTARTLARVEEAAAEYRRWAQATRVEAEVAEAKADALAGAVASIRREVAP